MFCESCEMGLFAQLGYHLVSRPMKLRTEATYFLGGERMTTVELAALSEHSTANPGCSVPLKNLAGDKSIQKFLLSEWLRKEISFCHWLELYPAH